MHISTQFLASVAAAGLMALTPAALPQATAAPLPANETTDCLDQGKVWLVVDDAKGESLVNKCVDKAASGTKLLTDAGVSITKDPKTQMICAIEGEPATCPTKFDGNYWHYYSAGKDGKWVFSKLGADQSKPAAGSFEGWCYGKECTPSMPLADQSGSASSTPASASAAASSTPATDSTKKSSKAGPISLVVVAAAVGGFLAWRQANKKRA